MIRRLTHIGEVARVPLLSDSELAKRLKALPDGAARVRLYGQTMDPAHLGVDLKGVTHVTIRMLDGTAPGEAEISVLQRGHLSPDDGARYRAAAKIELARRCILFIDGDPARPIRGEDGIERYPFSALAEMPDAYATALEALTYHETLGTLGEWPASLSAPPCDATPSSAEAATPSSLAPAAPACPTQADTAGGSKTGA